MSCRAALVKLAVGQDATAKDLSNGRLEKMSAIKWLEGNAPGFANLSQDERDLIMQFSLLWSLFEGEVVNLYASVKAIEQA